MSEYAWQIAVKNFARAILHGDEIHRQWLLDAADAFIKGRHLPPPRDGKGTIPINLPFPPDKIPSSDE